MVRIVEIIGGLGNQMFQYAFFLYLKNKSHIWDRLYVDIEAMKTYDRHYGLELEKVFNLSLCPISNGLHRNLQKRSFAKHFVKSLYEHSECEFDEPVYCGLRPYRYYRGYWQNEGYFVDIEPMIREAFQFNINILSEKTKANASKMNRELSVSIHVRRGDYENLPEAKAMHGGICSLDYYHKAIDFIRQRLGSNICFYLFSDDVNWMEENLQLENRCIIDWNQGEDSWQDMYLMSCCRHHIIANSSFSWWAAWLNPNKSKIVLTPNKWFNHTDAVGIVPESWIKIPVF